MTPRPKERERVKEPWGRRRLFRDAMLTVIFEERVSVEGMGCDLVKCSVKGSSRYRDSVS